MQGNEEHANDVQECELIRSLVHYSVGFTMRSDGIFRSLTCVSSALCQHSPIHSVHEPGSLQHRRLHQKVHHGFTSKLSHFATSTDSLGNDVHVVQRRTDCSATVLFVQGVSFISHRFPRVLQLSGADDPR